MILVSLILALAVPALALQDSAAIKPSWFFPYLLAVFGGYLGVAVWRAIQQPQPNRVQPAIKRAIFGLIVLDALLAVPRSSAASACCCSGLLIPGIIFGTMALPST